MENMNQLKVYKPNTGFCIGYGDRWPTTHALTSSPSIDFKASLKIPN